jgi:hypothetical protein
MNERIDVVVEDQHPTPSGVRAAKRSWTGFMLIAAAVFAAVAVVFLVAFLV